MPYIGNQPGTGVRSRFIYTATASQTTFSGADDNSKTLKYADSDYIDVYLNGVCLVPGTDYTASTKTSVVLTQAASLSDTLEVVAYDIATIADTVSKADGGTFDGSVGFGIAPERQVHIAGNPAIMLMEDTGGSTDDKKVQIQVDSGVFEINSRNDDLSSQTDNIMCMEIDTGDVGIGTNAPNLGSSGQGLHIKGTTNKDSTLKLDSSTANYSGVLQFTENGTDQWRIGYDATNNHLEFTESGVADRMIIQDGGSVGIGVTPYSHSGLGTFSTVNNLSLIGNGTSGAYVGYNIYYNSDWKYAESSAACLLSMQNDGALTFRQGASGTKDNAVSLSERFRVDTSGNLLVGRTSNPSGVSNCIYALGNYGITTGSGANVHINSEGLFFRSTSSERYKNTIQDATHGLTELLTLRPVTFKNNEDGDRIYGGLIAEEVHEAGLTEFVQYNDDNEPDALDYGNIVSLCIKAIQEQQATITAQATKIDALETQNTTQATQIADLITRVTALEAG